MCHVNNLIISIITRYRAPRTFGPTGKSIQPTGSGCDNTRNRQGYWNSVRFHSKSVHLLPMRETFTMNKLERLKTTDKIAQIQQKLQAARSRKKSYADKRRKPFEFHVGDRVMLKVSPWKGVVRFGKKGKLAPRYIGPFEIIQRIGPVAYRLRLPDELSGVHDVFHVSNLKKCLADKSLLIPVEEIQVDEQLHFIEEPLKIMNREVKQLKRSRILIIKVRWNSKRGPDFTWEREDYMKSKYPHLFAEKDVPDNDS
ncbi:hypothetical protein E3N88_18597 [Mikania micrantha]|uniref:Tf2-1-like SH3-like domain-containing protein n=1 Tax=Mikania micrantha TaxID=192012 RepID=A0A5N6NKV2_9ASTR|nr:hypothetical protein E3N88_18597 [Mikania micrantha]